MLGGFLTLIILGSAFGYLIYRYFQGRKLVATDDLFSQNYVTVDYKTGKMTVRGKSFHVQKVTGITMEYHYNNKRFAHHLVIKVDDMAKPVHRAAVVGSRERAGILLERVCVALRKAGGPDFQ